MKVKLTKFERHTLRRALALAISSMQIHRESPDVMKSQGMHGHAMDTLEDFEYMFQRLRD